MEAAKKKRVQAESQAERLLRYFLTEGQRKSLIEENHFDVPVGERIYRIQRGRAGNIVVIEGSRHVERMCVHPAESVPDADTMLSQLLGLQHNEEAVRRVANITALVPDRRSTFGRGRFAQGQHADA